MASKIFFENLEKKNKFFSENFWNNIYLLIFSNVFSVHLKKISQNFFDNFEKKNYFFL